MSENERILSKGLDEMAKYTSEHDSEIKEMFSGTSMLLAASEHNIQLERALGECRREYNLLIDAYSATAHSNSGANCKIDEGKPG